MGISYSRRYSVPVYLWTTTSVLLRRRPLLGRAVSILLLLLLAELVTRSDVSDMLAARITRVLLAEYCYAVVVTHNSYTWVKFRYQPGLTMASFLWCVYL